jgi:hypothetical protein
VGPGIQPFRMQQPPTATRFLVLCVIVASAGLFGGCRAQPYEQRHTFTPRPGEIVANRDSAVRTLATVIGVRREDRRQDIPRSVEVAMRIENTGQQAATFDPNTLELVSANLRSFPRPMTTPADTVDIPPGGQIEVFARFPIPEGDAPLDITGLNLRWTLAVGEQRVPQSLSFQRAPDDHRRGYDRSPRFGVGVGIGTRF